MGDQLLHGWPPHHAPRPSLHEDRQALPFVPAPSPHNSARYEHAVDGLVVFDGTAAFTAPDVRSCGNVGPAAPQDHLIALHAVADGSHGLYGRVAHDLVAFDGRAVRTPSDVRPSGDVGSFTAPDVRSGGNLGSVAPQDPNAHPLALHTVSDGSHGPYDRAAHDLVAFDGRAARTPSDVRPGGDVSSAPPPRPV